MTDNQANDENDLRLECDYLKNLVRELAHSAPSDLLDTIREERRQVDDLKASLQQDALHVRSFSMGPQQAVVYSALSKYGRVSRENMHSIIYGSKFDPPGEGIIRVLIFKIRQKIPPTEKIVTIRGWGWALEKQEGNDIPCNVTSVGSLTCAM